MHAAGPASTPAGPSTSLSGPLIREEDEGEKGEGENTSSTVHHIASTVVRRLAPPRAVSLEKTGGRGGETRQETAIQYADFACWQRASSIGTPFYSYFPMEKIDR